MLGYWGALLPAAILVTILLIVHPWPGGRDDVLLRAVSALFATAWLVWAFWTAVRRRLRYWQPCERQRRSIRLAAISRKWWVFLVVAILGGLLGVLAWGSFDTAWNWNACEQGSPSFTARPAISILSGHAAPNQICLQESSTSVNIAFVVSAILLAAVMTYTWSWLNRGLAVRRWRRMVEPRTRTGKPEGEPECTVALDQAAAPHLAEHTD
jgi:hypothetical protein